MGGLIGGALGSQRGIALPTALIALLLLAALAMAFSVLAATEPTIAGNQLLVAQARALAESGVERALWALSAGKTDPGGAGVLPTPLPAPTPVPYDGSGLVEVAAAGKPIGGFRVVVTAGAAPNERTVVATGWAPGGSGVDPRTQARQRVAVTLMDFGFGPLDLPCALCVRGDLRMVGRGLVDARSDTSCGSRHGTWSPGTTARGDTDVYGADGNDLPNEATDAAQGQGPALFDAHAFSVADLRVLRAYARAKGTYYQGTVTFDGLNRLPDGVVFVDTASGADLDAATAPGGDLARVSISGRAAAGPSGVFRGWLIVNGGLRLGGDFEAHGLIYAVDDIVASGGGRIRGQVVSQNVKDSMTVLEDGGLRVLYGCRDARTGGGSVPEGFVVKPGTYRELPDP